MAVLSIVPLALFAGLVSWRANYKRTHGGAEPPAWRTAVFTVVGAWVVIAVTAFLVAAL